MLLRTLPLFLKDAVDTAFKAIVADGTYANSIKKYRLPVSSTLF